VFANKTLPELVGIHMTRPGGYTSSEMSSILFLFRSFREYMCTGRLGLRASGRRWWLGDSRVGLLCLTTCLHYWLYTLY